MLNILKINQNKLIINKKSLYSNAKILSKLNEIFNQSVYEKSEKTITVNLDNEPQIVPYGTSCKSLLKDKNLHSMLVKINDNVSPIGTILNENCEINVIDVKSEIGKIAANNTSAFIVNSIFYNTENAKMYTTMLKDSEFYCDLFIPSKNISSNNFELYEKKYIHICSKNESIESVKISINEAKELFSTNEYKLFHLNRLKTTKLFLHRLGNFFDVNDQCLLSNTGTMPFLKLTRCGSSNMGSQLNILQRVYGISFETKDDLDKWLFKKEKQDSLDHRLIGVKQELFFFHKSSPGSPFLLPDGVKIMYKLQHFLREQYYKRGFSEVITPTIFNNSLWHISGHLSHYKENIFRLDWSSGHSNELSDSTDDVNSMSLKPMNCPAHCLIYQQKSRNANDLPLRLAEFSGLHRDEPASRITGLTRVRKFHQDDAHIFCTIDQIEQEILSSLDFLQLVYTTMGFKFRLSLSTRPSSFMGTLEEWDYAEKQLQSSLEKMFGNNFDINHGDGAFYGPKIDIMVCDGSEKYHQCATIQLDFQLPLRFDLQYYNPSTKEFAKPVIIHRAILGSIERFLAILIESNAGRWPFWLNPKQIIILPVMAKFNNYAENVCNRIREHVNRDGYPFNCNTDTCDSTSLKFKIQSAQSKQYNCIIVVGEKEVNENKISLRTRDGKSRGLWDVDNLITILEKWQNCRSDNVDKIFK